ncbi:serine-threonine protein kinase, putative [Entamoeba invadens IP1]|uniref:Serine-threonine protein kinase, putative n=1 Tax=Entamoeba invadens IP1 TaxID=370355 RepID=A0A0A1U6C8_ENTIV|nr:serine-threonine protein kinase, putative [Entamoeba invadens IP1]ELP88440.1 serine-threonine protein kinase, putative [Entamoeba invadens IP1]|eukprot:XP_004255211.1 serine-threonine protein kinase, putative [Entamoeba invadens IP1]
MPFRTLLNLFLVVVFTWASPTKLETETFEDIDLFKADQDYYQFVTYIGYNELSEQRHNLPMYYYLNDTIVQTLFFDSTLSIVKNRTAEIRINGMHRPQIVDMRESLFVLDDSKLSYYDLETNPPEILINSTLNGKIGQYSPLSYILFQNETIQTDLLITCVDYTLAGVKLETLTLKVSSQFPCGEYVTSGSDLIAVKNKTDITIYQLKVTDDGYYLNGEFVFHKKITMAEYLNPSETYQYDPIRFTRNNVLYVAVSKYNKVAIFDASTDYSVEEEITNIPFYSESNSGYVKPYKNIPFDNIGSYGQIIVVGTPGYSTKDMPHCGGAYVFFDNILDKGYTPRIVEFIHIIGKIAYGYTGYSVCSSRNSVWLGGLSVPQLNYIYDNISVSIKSVNKEYCNVTNCLCHSNMYFIDGKCSYEKGEKDILVIVVSVVVAVLGVLVIVTIAILIITFTIPRKNKKQTFSVKNYDYDFTLFEYFPLEFDTTKLTFGSEDMPLNINVETSHEINITNKTKNYYTFNFNPLDREDHRYAIHFDPKMGILSPRITQKVCVKLTMLCTCSIDEIIDVQVHMGKGESSTGDHAALELVLESSSSLTLDYTEFQKEKVIGEGSFGIVYKGVYRGVDVAIKETKSFSWPEDVLESFIKEVEMMDKMRCPYIINFIGASFTPEHYSIVTEFAKFGSLKSAYESSYFSNTLMTKMLLDVARGMVFLHGSNLVHRDLKPENVLVVSMNNQEKVNAKISDFGTARTAVMNDIANTMTRGIGTPIYMSPEMLLNLPYNLKTDIYSFAIVCYEVFLRKIPYQQFSHTWDVADFVLKGDRLPILSTFPQEMGDLIKECWADACLRPPFTEIETRLEKMWNAFSALQFDFSNPPIAPGMPMMPPPPPAINRASQYVPTRCDLQIEMN